MKFQHILIDAHNPPDPHCKIAGDLDGDGLADLLVASARGGGAWWYRAPGWSKHLLAEGSFTTDMAIGDIDGDGFPDVVIPENDTGLLWFRNPLADGRDPASGPWKAYNIGPAGAHMHDVELADLDGDGQAEIVLSPSEGRGRLSWFDPPDNPAGGLWSEHVIAETDHAHGLAVGDVDGDGRLEIAVAKMHQATPPQEVAVYAPSENGWEKTVLAVTGSHCIRLIDLAGAGKLSVFGCNWNDNSPTGGAVELWIPA